MLDPDPPANRASDRAGEATLTRQRVVVRKRRPRGPHKSRHWAARASRRRTVRAAVVCVGVLLLMAAGLYLGLSRQDSSPAEGAGRPAPVYAYRV
jgi:hypothetical protein